MIRQQKHLVGMEQVDEQTADEMATIKELLQEVLKELRQIRGILGHLAADLPAPRVMKARD